MTASISEKKRELREKVLFKCVNYTTDREKKIINEAIGFKGSGDAIRKGWKYAGGGAYRAAYKKENIIVKFDRGYPSCKIEVEHYKKLPKRLRRHFARIFFATSVKTIQRRVDLMKTSDDRRKWEQKVYNLKNLLGLVDMQPGHNVGFYKGRLCVFDWNVLNW